MYTLIYACAGTHEHVSFPVNMHRGGVHVSSVIQ